MADVSLLGSAVGRPHHFVALVFLVGPMFVLL